MFVKAILFTQLVLISNVVPRETEETDYFVVSTTHLPEDSAKSRYTTIQELQESTKQILNRVTELEESNSLLQSIVRVQNIQLETQAKLLQNYSEQTEKEHKNLRLSNTKLHEKVAKLEQANILLEHTLESHSKRLQSHTEQIEKLQVAENETQKAQKSTIEDLDNIKIKNINLIDNDFNLDQKVSELENTNLLLENRTRVQNVQFESQAKSIQNQAEQIKELQDKIAKLNNKLLPSNCKEVLEGGSKVSGVYRIKSKLSPQSFEVWCDMETKNGGWIYVINRFDGSQNFNLNWTHYKNGFGKINGGEFWLGLEHLHQLTASKRNELLVELTDWDNITVYANYRKFEIGSENEGYKLKAIEEYSGDAGDALVYHEGVKFSTPDKDQDAHDTYSCAANWKAGWWYERCYTCLLTGAYKDRIESHAVKKGELGIQWEHFHNYNYSLKEVKMMIKPLF